MNSLKGILWLAAALAVPTVGCRNLPAHKNAVASSDAKKVAGHIQTLLYPNAPTDAQLDELRQALDAKERWVVDAIAAQRSPRVRSTMADLRPVLSLAKRWRQAWPDNVTIQVQMYRIAAIVISLMPEEPQNLWSELRQGAKALLDRYPRDPGALENLATMLPRTVAGRHEALRLLARCKQLSPTDVRCEESWQDLGVGFTHPRCVGVDDKLRGELAGKEAFTGSDVRSIEYKLNSHGKPYLVFRMTTEGATKLETTTTANIGKDMTLRSSRGSVIFQAAIQEPIDTGSMNTHAIDHVSQKLASLCHKVVTPAWPADLPPQPRHRPEPTPEWVKDLKGEVMSDEPTP